MTIINSLFNITDPTLDAVNKAMEDKNASRKRRPPALGASSIGENCTRKLWMAFRMVKTEFMTAEVLKRIDDGNYCEGLEAERLNMVEGIDLQTIDFNTGYAFMVVTHDGHFKGKLDGKVTGLLHDPSNEYIWEEKCSNDDKIHKLTNIIAHHGMENALELWDNLYYSQAVVYMHITGIPRHYMTVSSPGGRRSVSLLTPPDPEYATSLLNKAESIINSRTLPVGDEKSCRYCTFKSVCFEGEIAAVNCRTCMFSRPAQEGRWVCEKYGDYDLNHENQTKGCKSHLYIPSLLTFADVVEVDLAADIVTYRSKVNGAIFKNSNISPDFYTSQEIYALDYRLLGNGDLAALKENFGATIPPRESDVAKVIQEDIYTDDVPF